MNDRRTRVAAILLAFLVAGLPMAARVSPNPNWAAVVVFGILAVGLDLLSFPLPGGGSISMAFVMPFSALLTNGVLGGVVAAAIGSISVADIRSRRSAIDQLLNSLQLVTSMLAAGLLWTVLGGQPLITAASLAAPLVRVFAAMAAALCFFAVNSVSTAYLFWARDGESLKSVLRNRQIPKYGASLITLSLLSLVMAELLHLHRYLSVALMFVPFVVARMTFRASVELNHAYLETVRSLVSAIEAKDAYTRGHSQRVAELSRAIGHRLGLRGGDLGNLEVAALLHDIGKIGVSGRVLNAKGQVDADGWRQIRAHPCIGADLVAQVELLQAISHVIRHHHERFDGSGYPDNLAGDNIPLHSRILSVADAYDAMTSRRAYRDAMPHAAALREIMQLAGKQFDARVAEALASVFESTSLSGSSKRSGVLGPSD